jgi:hypothetical protein
MKEQKFFAPTNDFVFKAIFGDERKAHPCARSFQRKLRD